MAVLKNLNLNLIIKEGGVGKIIEKLKLIKDTYSIDIELTALQPTVLSNLSLVNRLSSDQAPFIGID